MTYMILVTIKYDDSDESFELWDGTTRIGCKMEEADKESKFVQSIKKFIKEKTGDFFWPY